MAFCDQCGEELSAQARFCASCGRPVAGARAKPASPAKKSDPAPDPTPEPPAPAERAARLVEGLPDWARSDWPAAAVASLIVLGVCLAVGVVYGAVAGWAANGEAGAIVSGAVTGVYLPFAMFGVEIVAVRFAGAATFGFSFATLPLPLAATVVLAVYRALRFAWPRVARTPASRLAFVGKLALLVTLLMTMLAALLSFGEPGVSGNGLGQVVTLRRDAFAADVSIASAAVYPFALVGLIGVAILVWRRVRMLGGRVHAVVDTDIGRACASGALAFVAIAAVLAVVVLIADTAVADSGQGKVSTLVAFFATGLNRGIAATAFAMGGAVARLGSHTSLFDWGSYEIPGPGTAPLLLFAWLGLAPAAVAYATLRSLDREGPDNEQGVARVAAAGAIGFVVASLVLVVVTAQPEVAAGSPRAAFGLALLWASLAAAAAGALWARSHGVRWSALEPTDADDEPHDSWSRRDRGRRPTEIFDPPDPPPTLVDPDRSD